MTMAHPNGHGHIEKSVDFVDSKRTNTSERSIVKHKESELRGRNASKDAAKDEKCCKLQLLTVIRFKGLNKHQSLYIFKQVRSDKATGRAFHI